MKIKILGLIFLALINFGCKKNATDSSAVDIQETAQQVGDTMASMDEAGKSSGSIASFEKSFQNSFDRYAPNESTDTSSVASLFLPKAEAVACFGFGFGSCSSNTIVRNYNNCTIGSASLSGDVTLVWGGGAAACSLSSSGQFITRTPNFTLTGRRGATLSVTKTGTIGQRLTWASGSGFSKVFNFTNDGINRKFTDSNSNVIFDQTSVVSGTLTVTGTDRNNRVITSVGGTLKVTNNLTSVVCDYTPSNVTWSSTTCNCPVAGSWSGSCSDGKSTTLDITGCGTANYTEGSETQSVSFDRCSSN
jgi:hypothetical protein